MAESDPNPRSPPDPTHLHRVEAFKSDLKATIPINVIQKHITTGDPAIIPGDVYFELRRRVAENFHLHPSEVVLVGSCRLGFTLKRNRKTNERYRPARPTSDVDLAIVSSGQFDSYWDRVFFMVRKNRDWSLSHGRKFTRDLFNGWITPSELPNLPQFADALAWTEYFAELTRLRICGLREVKPRLYRSWSRLEAYQEIMVNQCRIELVGERA
jgi:hypothetical protein